MKLAGSSPLIDADHLERPGVEHGEFRDLVVGAKKECSVKRLCILGLALAAVRISRTAS
jgi:hypothetical protein